LFPSKLGYEASGIVEAVGSNVDAGLIGKTNVRQFLHFLQTHTASTERWRLYPLLLWLRILLSSSETGCRTQIWKRTEVGPDTVVPTERVRNEAVQVEAVWSGRIGNGGVCVACDVYVPRHW
jgi:hypothetical protein